MITLSFSTLVCDICAVCFHKRLCLHCPDKLTQACKKFSLI